MWLKVQYSLSNAISTENQELVGSNNTISAELLSAVVDATVFISFQYDLIMFNMTTYLVLSLPLPLFH